MWHQATSLRREAARLWAALVELHACVGRWRCPWPTPRQFEDALRGQYAPQAMTVQELIQRFCAAVDATRTRRRRRGTPHEQPGDAQACYPWRTPQYVNVLWQQQAIRIDRGHQRIVLGGCRSRRPLVLHLPAALPAGAVVVRAELGFRELVLTLHRARPVVEPPAGVAAGDQACATCWRWPMAGRRWSSEVGDCAR